ncbi:MAG: hypothetical protein ACFFB3_14575 [Candidatus Hodarchaeota archaeon]
MAAEMVGKKDSEIKTIQIEGFTIHIRSFSSFQITFVSDESLAPENLMHILELRFLKKYGETLLANWSLVSTFIPFRKILYDVIQNESDTKIDDSKSILPEKQLEANEIFEMPHHLQSTALAILSLQEGTINDIAEESKKDANLTKKNLLSLREMGFIGTKLANGKRKYFCSVEV